MLPGERVEDLLNRVLLTVVFLSGVNVDHLVMVGIGELKQLELGVRTAGYEAGDCVGVDVDHLVMVGVGDGRRDLRVVAGREGCVVVPPSPFQTGGAV